MIQFSNSFILFSSVLLSSTGLLIWLVLIGTLLYFYCVMGFKEPIRCEICLPTFVICFTCGMYMHGISIYNKVWNAFCFHHCRPEVLTLVASHVQLQALQGAQRHFWTSNLMETYFINEQICNYAAISKSKVQHTMKSSLNCVVGARNALQAHCMLQVMSLDMFIS